MSGYIHLLLSEAQRDTLIPRSRKKARHAHLVSQPCSRLLTNAKIADSSHVLTCKHGFGGSG
jgi:hypothetical protein